MTDQGLRIRALEEEVAHLRDTVSTLSAARLTEGVKRTVGENPRDGGSRDGAVEPTDLIRADCRLVLACVYEHECVRRAGDGSCKERVSSTERSCVRVAMWHA